jgi:hypothetical protein
LVCVDNAKKDVVLEEGISPCKARRGIPTWFQGNVSSAFANHIYWPSPPKKNTSTVRKVLFPACASSKEWRDLHRQKIACKSFYKGKRVQLDDQVTEKQQKQNREDPKVQKRPKLSQSGASGQQQKKGSKVSKRQKLSKSSGGALAHGNEPTSLSKEPLPSAPLPQSVASARNDFAPLPQELSVGLGQVMGLNRRQSSRRKKEAQLKKSSVLHGDEHALEAVCCLFCGEAYEDPPDED